MALASLGLTACRDSGFTPQSSSKNEQVATSPGGWFEDETQQVGLDFVHVNGLTGQFYYPEIIGPGVALFDYDNDGDLDVFLVQGQTEGPRSRCQQDGQPAQGPPL